MTQTRLLRSNVLTLVTALSLVPGCAAPRASTPSLPAWSFAEAMVFPADLSLARAEDGIALPDGKLIVADQVHGLRVLERNGQSRPFGDLPGAGFANDPPRRHGAPNGVSLEPDGMHLLVSDVLGGEIYRVEVTSGETQRVYSHPFGVNSAIRDSSGAIWFTQSARNTEEQGEAGMFRPVEFPVAEGALWRLPYEKGEFAAEAVLVEDGLFYANGITIDESRQKLYLCELAADRVLEFSVDVATGSVGPARTLFEMQTPDNIERDADGRLWIVSPVRNEVLVFDPDTGSVHSAFHQQSAAQVALAAEWARRGAARVPRLDLLTPALFEPLPGILTGVILGSPDGAVYVTGLGNALIRLAAPATSASELNDFATRYAAAWSSQNPTRLASFYADHGSLIVNSKTPATGREAIAAKARAFMQAFPDMVVTMDSIRHERDRVVFHWTWTGTNTGPGGTGRPVHIQGHEQWTFSPTGRIALSVGHYDEAEYERQMSEDPAPR